MAKYLLQEAPILEPLINGLLSTAHFYLHPHSFFRVYKKNWYLMCRGASPICPPSASTSSPPPRLLIKEFLNMQILVRIPHSYGPLIQTMSPERMHMPTSYRKPDFLNLWLSKSRPCSAIRKSVPSTVIKQSFPLSCFKRLSQRIWKEKSQ